MRAVIYTRISRDREGGGLGVERQRTDCLELANRLGWTVIETFTDNDISAFSGRKRPGYEAMCQTLEDGAAQGLLIWHPDRLHRRPVELESFIDLCDRKRIEVQTVRAGAVDLSTPSGKMVARMLGAAARHEVEHAIERQKRAKYQAAMDGKFRGGRRPFGFESDGVSHHSIEAEAIREAARKLLAGVSLRRVTREWNEAGLRTSFFGNEFEPREVKKILLRPRNAGLVLHEGKVIGNAQWDPVLDHDTFTALNALLTDPARSKNVVLERKWMGSNVYRCGICGAQMLRTSTNGSKKQRPYYVCRAGKGHLARTADHVDSFVSELVIERLSAPDAQVILGGDFPELSELQTRRAALQARLEQLGIMFAEGDLDGSQLKVATQRLRQEIGAIETRISDASRQSILANLVLQGDDLRAAWEQCGADIQGKVIDTLMTVTILPAPRGRRPGGVYFDPSFVRIEWKQEGS